MARKKKNNSKPDPQEAKGERSVKKTINGEEFSSKYPDMSQIKYTKKQIGYRNLLSQAAQYAQALLNDPAERTAYQRKVHNDKRRRDTSLYHNAIKDFMAVHSQKVCESDVLRVFRKYQEKYQLSERELKAIKYLVAQGTITNARYCQLNDISRITATRDLRQLVQKGILTPPATKGAGAVYGLTSLNNADK